MAKLSPDLRAGVLHPRENQFLTTAIASASAGTAIYADGCSSFMLNVSGTFVATLLVEGSIDGATWVTMPLRPVTAAAKTLVMSLTAAGQWIAPNPGFTQLRVRCSAFTSGSAAYTLAASNAVLDQSIEAATAVLHATVTAATGVAATLTIAAPGAGLRHYLTSLRIERHTSTLLTAGATPVIVTTTNLPGARAYSIPADAAPQGQVYKIEEQFSRPIASSAQNTATTIVAPLTTGVIWRIAADYYVAP